MLSPQVLGAVEWIFLAIQVIPCLADWPSSFPGAGSQVIGYRTVGKAVADVYQEQGLIYDSTASTGGAQIGEGVYLSPSAGEWQNEAGDPYYCAVSANTARFTATPKIWIPDSFPTPGCDDPFDRVILWAPSGGYAPDYEVNMQQYFDTVGESGHLQKTVRISLVSGNINKVQFLLPPGLLNGNGGGLDLKVYCLTDKAAISAYGTVDYDGWSRVNEEGKYPM